MHYLLMSRQKVTEILPSKLSTAAGGIGRSIRQRNPPVYPITQEGRKKNLRDYIMLAHGGYSMFFCEVDPSSGGLSGSFLLKRKAQTEGAIPGDVRGSIHTVISIGKPKSQEDSTTMDSAEDNSTLRFTRERTCTERNTIFLHPYLFNEASTCQKKVCRGGCWGLTGYELQLYLSLQQ